MSKAVVLEGVRTRHLRIASVAFPHRAFTVLTGPSGSGKTTLLLDTLHAEARRRLEELVAVERQRMVAHVARPPIDRAAGLLPTLAHARETPGIAGSRTLATLGAIDDALALLAAREGGLACPTCDAPMRARTSEEVADALLATPAGGRVTVLAPLGAVSSERRDALLAEGWSRVRVGGRLAPLEEVRAPFEGEIVIDRIALREGVRGRLVDAIELAWKLGAGAATLAVEGAPEEESVSVDARCPRCTFSIPRTTPEDLVWSSPRSRCSSCAGTGLVLSLDEARAVDRSRALEGGAIRAWGTSAGTAKSLVAALAKAHGVAPKIPLSQQERGRVDAALGLTPSPIGTLTVLGELLARVDGDGDPDDALPRPRSFLAEVSCPGCAGTGRSGAFRAHLLRGERLTALERAPLEGAYARLFPAPAEATGRFAPVWRELERRLATARTLGLGHLALCREGRTLSRGELQRARLVAQLGAPLESVMHLLDEPTDGLHPLDARAVIDAVRALVAEGATVVSIAHDPLTIASSDHAVVLGPGAGSAGGLVVAEGEPRVVATPASPRPRPRSRPSSEGWTLADCTKHHLAGNAVRVPRGALVTLTGVSGSGKSTLLREGLAVAGEARRFAFDAPAGHGRLEGPAPTSVLFVDDRPLARGVRSTVASAIGALDPIRDAYAATAEARARGYGAGRFSHNVRGGRCERCEGTGIEPGAIDRYATEPCAACGGLRYGRETNEVRLHGHGIGDLLARPACDLAELLRGNPKIAPRLDALVTLGLGHLALGRATATLSSGEAKRVVLARALGRATDVDGALVLLDEPAAGLSSDDVERLLDATEQLRARGATVVVTEHRAAVIAASDWIVELGPGPGPLGGRVVVQGTLEDVLACEASVTRRALA